MISNENVLDRVVTGQYCIGCGACSIQNNVSDFMTLTSKGMYQPSNLIQTTEINEKIKKICPFSGEGKNEDDIGKDLFSNNQNHCSEIGYYEQAYAGHVEEKEFREKGSSGGVITWVLTEMLNSNMIDYVVHVKPKEDSKVLFEYGISKTQSEIASGSKSRYYPIEMSQVIDFIKNNEGRYVVVGLPCFVKTIRRICDEDKSFANKIKYCVGLVCGHLKSKAFSEILSYQAGIEPNQLESIDFRVKLENRPASRYGFSALSANQMVTKPMEGLMGGNWGHNLFRYPACSYCDDVFAETADLTVGDAWLPQYSNDYKGTSVVVVRNKQLKDIIERGMNRHQLVFDILDEAQVIKSQEGGLRDRREGLAFRLHLKNKSNTWFPEKRVAPSERGLTKSRKKLYKTRAQVSLECHDVWIEAKQSGNYQVFLDYFSRISEDIKKYGSDRRLHKRIINKSKSIIKKISFIKNPTQ